MFVHMFMIIITNVLCLCLCLYLSVYCSNWGRPEKLLNALKWLHWTRCFSSTRLVMVFYPFSQNDFTNSCLW
jgi:hypothetical protein